MNKTSINLSPLREAFQHLRANVRIQNPNCDGSHCQYEKGEVRKLPLNKTHSSNLILCNSCTGFELAFRFKENKRLADYAKFDLPSWEELEVYE